MNDVVENPFRGAVAPAAQNAVAVTDQQRAVAEVQAAMMIARANPRDPMAAMDRILNSCARPTLANSALYQYSKGGTDVSGPSIRLAEAIAQGWGNIQYGVRELEQRPGESTIQAYAWDVETNTRREMTFQVPHIRRTKKGTVRLEDPRDIYEMVANQGARRVRACILGVIPGDVIETAVSACESTMKAKADTSPEAISKMIAAFSEYGVTRDQLQTRIQRHLEAIQPAQMVALKKIYASLRDGMSTPADWFDVEPQGSPEVQVGGIQAVKEALSKRKPTAPIFDLAGWKSRIDALRDSELVALELDAARTDTSNEHQAEMVAHAQRRLEELTNV